MKTKGLLLVVLALVVAGSISVAPAAADDAVVPFKATYATHPVQVGFDNGVITLEIPGEGQATHLGKSTYYGDSWVDIRSDTWIQTGEMELKAANGDKLFGTFAGEAGPTGPTSVEFSGGFTITGGTGRFEGVTGTGRYWGTADGNEGTLDFDGELTK